MMRLLRRLFWLGLLAGVGVAVSRLVAQRRSSATAPAWTSQPATQPPAAAPEPTADPAPAAGGERSRWVEPVDGECPEGYPIKANDNSGIFHVPGGRFYARTVAERCYATAEDAIADGYRPAKA